MNQSFIEICGFQIDLSHLSIKRLRIFWNDPYFISHLPTTKINSISKKNKILKLNKRFNKIKFISFPFLIISKLILELLKKQQFLLHVASLSYNDSLILLIGPSGAGKSTIAAELLIKGFNLIGDDKIIFNKKMQVISSNSIISLRHFEIAKKLSNKLGLKIKKSDYTKKFYLQLNPNIIIKTDVFKKIFVFRVGLDNRRFRLYRINENSVTYDLFKDALATVRGFEGFSVDPPMISDLALVASSIFYIKRILKNIRSVIYQNKNNLFYIGGHSSKVTNKIIKIIKE